MGCCEAAASVPVVRCFNSSRLVNDKRQRIDEMQALSYEIANQELIPGLPNDVALQCLVRIPVQAHVQLQRVSRKWRELVNSIQYYEERKREGTTMHFVCTLQTLPKKRQRQQSTTVGNAASLGAASSNTSSSSSPPPPVLGVSVLNPRQRTWERLSHIPEHPHGLPLFCRLVAVNGNLVVLGGWDPVTWETLRTVYVYNFSSQSWHRGADMPSTRSSFACAVLNNQVFVAGGHDNRKSGLATAEVYNLEKDEWRTLPRMNEERDESTAVALNGKLYIISGYSTETQGQCVKSADVYEPENTKWTRIEDMMMCSTTDQCVNLDSSSSMSSGVKMAVLSGRLYTLDHKTLFSYSTTQNKWSSVATLPDELQQQLGADQMNQCATHVCLTSVKDSLVVLTGSPAASASSRSSSRQEEEEEKLQEQQQLLEELTDHQAGYNLAFLYKPPTFFKLKSTAADSKTAAFQLSTTTTTTVAAAGHSQELRNGSRSGSGGSCGGNWSQWEKVLCKDASFLSVPQFACAVEV